MVEVSYPFKAPASTNPSGNTMSENQWAAMMRYVLGSGVMAATFNDNLNELEVTPGATPLTVDIDTGAAWIQGHYYQSDAVNTLTIPQNTNAGTRADLIVLECKWGLNAGITATVVTGTAGATWPTGSAFSGPMPAPLTQTYGVKWQIALAQVYTLQNQAVVYPTSQMLDQRNFVGSGAAQSNAITVAMPNASDKMRQNADFQIPDVESYVYADEIINEAFAALPACGGTVMLSEGDCIISDTITPVNGGTLAGCGAQTTITLYGGAPAGTPMISMNYATGSVHNLLLNGAGTTSNVYTTTPVAGNNGINVVSAAGASIHDVSIQNMQNAGIVVTGGPANVVINNCSITACFGDGIDFAGEYSDISDNFIGNCGDVGIHINPTTNVASCNRIASNLITGCGMNGVYMDGTAGSGLFNMIGNNEVGQCGQAATTTHAGILISGSGANHTSVVSNYVWSAGAPVLKYGLAVQNGAVDTRAIANDLYDAASGTGSYDIFAASGLTLSGLTFNLYATHSP